MAKRKPVTEFDEDQDVFANTFQYFAQLSRVMVQDFDELVTRDDLILTNRDIRFLVDMYYQFQDDRKAKTEQRRSSENEPHYAIAVWRQLAIMTEETVKKQLTSWVKNGPRAVQWVAARKGMGPVLAAGLAAYIDMSPERKSFGNFSKVTRIAGMNPEDRWIGSDEADEIVADLFKEHNTKNAISLLPHVSQITTRKVESILRSAQRFGKGKVTKDSLKKAISLRPWNAKFKTLCWKIGETFVKNVNHGSYYGMVYATEKLRYTEKNDTGGFAQRAKALLEASKTKRGKKISANQRAHYKEGTLTKAHIHAMAKRKAVRQLLCHYWQLAYEDAYGEKAPNLYVEQHMGHVDIVTHADVESFEKNAEMALRSEKKAG